MADITQRTDPGPQFAHPGVADIPHRHAVGVETQSKMIRHRGDPPDYARRQHVAHPPHDLLAADTKAAGDLPVGLART